MTFFRLFFFQSDRSTQYQETHPTVKEKKQEDGLTNTAVKEKISASERLQTASRLTQFDENPNLQHAKRWVLCWGFSVTCLISFADSETQSPPST